MFCFSSHRAQGEPEKSQALCFPGSNTMMMGRISKEGVIGEVEKQRLQSWGTSGASFSVVTALLCDLGQAPSHSRLFYHPGFGGKT